MSYKHVQTSVPYQKSPIDFEKEESPKSGLACASTEHGHWPFLYKMVCWYLKFKLQKQYIF